MGRRVLVGINTLTAIDQMAYANHIQFFFRLGRNHLEDDFILYAPPRCSIDRMRNTAAKLALEHECTHLLFVDDDVLVPITAYQKLIDADKDIVAAWTLIRGYPFENMAFKFDEEKQNLGYLKTEEIEKSDSNLIEVDAVGFSCCLIKTDLLKKVTPPFFVTGPRNTEDVYFCIKSKEQNPKVSIFMDRSISTMHNLGAEYIYPENRAAFKLYCESVDGILKDAPPSNDRGDSYLGMVKNALGT